MGAVVAWADEVRLLDPGQRIGCQTAAMLIEPEDRSIKAHCDQETMSEEGRFGSIAAATHLYTSVRFTPASGPSAIRAAEECPSPEIFDIEARV
jgi:hypothetical protein